jgi:hypothetical protein
MNNDDLFPHYGMPSPYGQRGGASDLRENLR